MSDEAKRGFHRGAVRLTLPARVANDLDALQSSLAALAERMGHPNCATGCDTLFLQLERNFSVSDAVELNPQPLPPGGSDRLLPQDPVPIRVSVSPKVTDDIESLQKAIALTVQKLGCDACCSGFDIAFRRELDMLAINERLEVQGFGRFA
jgi:hypothetical protein